MISSSNGPAMTTRLLLASLLTALSLPVHAAENEAPPRVTKVTAYPDRATITRAVELSCSEEPSPAVFKGLPVSLDPTTVRASAALPSARIEGVSLSERVIREPYRAEVLVLHVRVEELDEKIRVAKQERTRARTAAEQAQGLRSNAVPFLNRELAQEKKPDTATWRSGLDTTRELIDDASEKQRAADITLRTLERDRADLLRKQGGYAAIDSLRTLEAEVLVRCPAKGTTTVELSYVVGGVNWTPVYEARAEEASGKIAFTVAADIVQGTGEDWKGIELTLSTAVSRRDARPPEPQRLNVSATEQENRKKVLVRRDEEISHLESASFDKGDLSSATTTPEFAAQDQGISVQLRVPGRVDLTGDSRPARVTVETIPLATTFKLFTAPKVLPHVFRSAEAINSARYPFLAGRVDLFSGGSYLGASHLERVAQGDKVKLAFGIMEGLKVRRITVREQQRDPSFLGSTRRFDYEYRIELTSYEAKPLTVTVQEHIPVSQMDDVKVIVDDKESTPGRELVPDDGIVSWKVTLAPKEKKDLRLKFVMEIPERYDSSGL